MIAEPLLQEEQRFTLFPILYHDIFAEYKKQRNSFWVPDEIDFSKDKQDWEKLTDDERHFIKNVLAFFAASDGIVSLNLMDNFTKEVKILEAQMCYSVQTTIEGIHNETYSIMIDNLIDDYNEKIELFEAVKKIKCVKQKGEWALKWTDTDTASFAQRLVAFTIVEGIFFSGSFCAIFWLKKRNLLPGLIASNEFIARDEGMHTNFGCLLYSKIKNKLDKETVYQMVAEALEIEKEFINESLPCRLIGMNNLLMNQYIEFVCDHLLVQLGYPKVYNQTNPFPFMDNISVEGKTNFFEHRVTQYQKADISSSNSNFDLTDDF